MNSGCPKTAPCSRRSSHRLNGSCSGRDGSGRARVAPARPVNGGSRVALPSIGTGRYGYPDAEAAGISVTALRGASASVRRLLLVARHERTAALWLDELTDQHRSPEGPSTYRGRSSSMWSDMSTPAPAKVCSNACASRPGAVHVDTCVRYDQ